MNKQDFFEAACNASDLTVTFYNGNEIPYRFKMYKIFAEQYDDEITIRGAYNDFIIVNINDCVVETDEYDEIEFLFSTDSDHKIGIVFK